MIEIKDLKVSYDKVVLENIDLKFKDQGIYCIFASSGRGKTTLLNVIAGLTKYSGTVNVEGTVSYMFQEDRLLNWMSCEENIFFVEPNAQKASEYMHILGIDEFKNKKPQELSGGMKRRCAFVRSLAYDADVYLLDEPFKGFDDENIRVACDILKKVSSKKLIIIVTHNENDAERLQAEKVFL